MINVSTVLFHFRMTTRSENGKRGRCSPSSCGWGRNRRCQAIVHDRRCKAPLIKINGKKIPKKTIEKMRNHDPPILPGSKVRGYICKVCLDYFTEANKHVDVVDDDSDSNAMDEQQPGDGDDDCDSVSG